MFAYDPLLSVDEITRAGAEPWPWGSPSPDVRVIITQTGDPAWLDLDPAWFPGLRVVYDGRNSLAPLVERLGPGVAYRGVGVPGDRRAPVAVD